MNWRSELVRGRAGALLLLIMMFGCDAGGFVLPHQELDPTSLRVHAEVASAVVAGISVEISAPDVEPPLIYNLPVSDGAVSGTVQVTAGSDRQFTLRAYDAGGIETHRGSATVDIVEGENPPLEVSVVPLQGDQTISATLGSIIVVVSPGADTTVVGGSLQLAAAIIDSLGDTISSSVNWATLAPSIAGVDSQGTVRGVAPGQARIVATYGFVGGASLIQVQDTSGAAPASVTVTPSADTLAVGETLQLAATVLDSSGNVLSTSVSWSSSNSAVATVDGTGLVTTSSTGTAEISATADGASGTSTLTVTGAATGTLTISPVTDTLYGVGDTLMVTAVARDAQGQVMSDPGIEWTSHNPDIATVDSMGKITAQALGVALITASAACCSADSGSFVVEAEITDPAQVTDLQISSVTENSVTLQWTEVDDGTGSPTDYALRYDSPSLSWGPAAGSEVTVAGTGIGVTTTFTVTGLAPSATYEFGVVAYRGTLNVDAVFGPLSNFVSATTAGGPLTAGSASATPGDGRVTLSATQPTGGTAPYTYQWHRSTSSGFAPGAGNALGGATGLSETDTTVANGTTYYYVLRASDNAGDSVYFQEVGATPDSARAGGLLFHSDWSTARGTSDAALRDTNKAEPWSEIHDAYGVLEVVSASGLDFPTPNVLQVNAIWRGNGARAGHPRITEGSGTLPIQGIGEQRYFRMYWQQRIPDAYIADGGVRNTHPVQDYTNGDQGETNWMWVIHARADGTYEAGFSMVYTDAPWPNDEFLTRSNLTEGVTYRVEWMIDRPNSTQFRIYPRVYLTDGTLLYDENDFLNKDGSGTLKQWYDAGNAFNWANVNNTDLFQIGLNGFGPDAASLEAHFPFVYSYQGAVCIRSDRWCGAY